MQTQRCCIPAGRSNYLLVGTEAEACAVERAEHLLAGARRCVYRITPVRG
ncbi:hypothetical protein ACFOLJ_28975 [Rugamonas sp. CCM 8940]|nr:hypothetical protein [Rugamonas sp. CCM 8940]MBJ7312296.1 hypothetical protein [Rugamonas sp. CCM 8940]